MDNTLKIWKYLIPRLKESEELTKIVPAEHINPLGLLEETKFPFIIYRRDSLVPTYTKHPYGGWTNTVSLSVSVYSDNYNETLEAANIIRDLLENYKFKNNEIKIEAIELSNSFEALANGCFEQNLNFNIIAV